MTKGSLWKCYTSASSALGNVMLLGSGELCFGFLATSWTEKTSCMDLTIYISPRILFSSSSSWVLQIMWIVPARRSSSIGLSTYSLYWPNLELNLTSILLSLSSPDKHTPASARLALANWGRTSRLYNSQFYALFLRGRHTSISDFSSLGPFPLGVVSCRMAYLEFEQRVCRSVLWKPHEFLALSILRFPLRSLCGIWMRFPLKMTMLLGAP